jgi:hypothetical protein
MYRETASTLDSLTLNAPYPVCQAKMHIPFLMNPARGVGFDHASYLWHCLRGTNANQHVNVIGCAVDDERRGLHFANDAAEVGEKIGADFGSDQRRAAFGAEDQVKDEAASGVGQVSFAPSELDVCFAAYPRLAPWAASLRRFAAGAYTVSIRCANRRTLRMTEILLPQFHFGTASQMNISVGEIVHAEQRPGGGW